MFKSNFSLSTDAHLEAAMFNRQLVQAWYISGNEIADYGVLIEEINDISVKINGIYYAKAACEFMNSLSGFFS